MSGAIGADQVGIRISPHNTTGTIAEEDVPELYGALLARLAPLELAYLHVMETKDRDLTLRLRKEWPTTLILNPATAPDFTGPGELALIEDGTADVIAFGALFLANPDLPARLAAGGPFNTPDFGKLFGGDHEGYTDYPALG